eukprot:TRINITY_DN20788_c0_g1_i1.p1 TRINITY_DN20788_c0_g1~~TRINITY_DN20788_c0_g1_i1.p1  ORF type:complete len:219 (-),score=51.46 TRINITY_DN20788_c0_g1_i1:302-958(-)
MSSSEVPVEDLRSKDVPVEGGTEQGESSVPVERTRTGLLADLNKRRAPVSQYMTKDPICFTREDSLKDAIKVLLEKKISGAPVVEKYDDDSTGMGKLVGIISEEDFLWKEVEANDEELADAYLTPFYWTFLTGDDSILERFEEQALKVLSRTVGISMNEEVLTVTPETPVSEAAGIMLDSKVKRLPVVAPREGGKPGTTVIGVVSRKDVLRHVSSLLD